MEGGSGQGPGLGPGPGGHGHPFRLSGQLLKRRDVLPGWRLRTFVVHREDYLLFYYLPGNSPLTSPPRGLLPLGGCRLHVLSEEDAGGMKHAFRLDHPWAPGKSWMLAARSKPERDRWVRGLRRAIEEAEAALREEEADQRGNEERHEAGVGTAGAVGDERRRIAAAAAASAPAAASASGDLPLDQLLVPGYEETTERAIRTLLEFAEPSDGWRLNFERRGVKAYKRIHDGHLPGARDGGGMSSFTTLKGQGIIRHHPISVLLAVMDNTIGRDIDPQFDYGRRVRIHNHFNFVDYLRYKGIFPVAPRDMYIFCHWRVLDDTGTIAIAVFSDLLGDHPPEKGCVRAEVFTAGWIIRPLDPPHCTAASCTYFSSADLKGFIPKALVDIATDPQPMLIDTIGRVLDQDASGRFKVNRHRFTGGGKGIGRYTAADIVPYVGRIHRHNLPDNGVAYAWLRAGAEAEAAEAAAEGGEDAEARRRRLLLQQQRFHQEVVARLEREARSQAMKEEVRARVAWLWPFLLGLALLLLSVYLAYVAPPLDGVQRKPGAGGSVADLPDWMVRLWSEDRHHHQNHPHHPVPHGRPSSEAQAPGPAIRPTSPSPAPSPSSPARAAPSAPSGPSSSKARARSPVASTAVPPGPTSSVPTYLSRRGEAAVGMVE